MCGNVLYSNYRGYISTEGACFNNLGNCIGEWKATPLAIVVVQLLM